MSYMSGAVATPGTKSKIGSAPSGRPSDESSKRTKSSVRDRLLDSRRVAMDCLICKDLERVFEFRHNDYIEARSAAYFRVSTALAAYKNVDKERAKSDLEEHQLVCVATKAWRHRVAASMRN
jgi:hypothetical protein